MTVLIATQWSIFIVSAADHREFAGATKVQLFDGNKQAAIGGIRCRRNDVFGSTYEDGATCIKMRKLGNLFPDLTSHRIENDARERWMVF